MSLIPYTNTAIEVEVSDRIYNETIFKQRAKFLGMEIWQSPVNNTVTVLVKMLVTLYASVNGGYGNEITGKGLVPYQVTLVADNNCGVNPQTGGILHVRTTESDTDWDSLLQADAQPLMLQGDFFNMLMHSQAVEIEPMLRNFILQADTAAFNKFV